MRRDDTGNVELSVDGKACEKSVVLLSGFANLLSTYYQKHQVVLRGILQVRILGSVPKFLQLMLS